MTAAGPQQETVAQAASATLRLAFPVIVNRVGMLLIATASTIMVGHAGERELAYFALAFSPQVLMLVIGIGVMVGTVILVSQAVGAGRHEACGAIWQTSLLLGLVVGLIYALIMIAGEPLLLLLGQTPDMAAGGGRAMLMFAPGMAPFLMFLATTLYLEGTGRARPGMVVTILANLVNVGLGYVLIYGALGLPAMGAEGANLATSVARWFMAVALIGWVVASRVDRERYGILRRATGYSANLKRAVSLGVPLAVANGLESGSFAAMSTMAGWIGASQLAGYQILMNVNAIVFMLAIGMGTATAVRCGQAVGRGDMAGLRRAGWVGVGLAAVLLLAIMAAAWAGGAQLVGLYSRDAAVLAVASSALWLMCLLTPLDGMQGVLAAALRGTADTMVPMAIFAFAFLIVGIPLGYFLGWRWGGGVDGLYWALIVACAIASSLLAWRFDHVCRRGVRVY